MTLQEAYLKNHNDEPVEESKELVLAWLDDMIAFKKRLTELMRECADLGTGKIVDGRYEKEYYIIETHFMNELHLGDGIFDLAEYLDIPLDEEIIKYSDGSQRTKYSFRYKNFVIFQLRREGGNNG